MVQSEMGTSGPGAALLTVYKAIDALSPVAVIMVGIAFGTRPEKQQPGDILVSRQIQAYEPQKVTGENPVPRGDRVTASTYLLDKFRSGDLDWQGAPVHFGLILSGEKLIIDKNFRDRLLQLEPEAIGGEMEGAGNLLDQIPRDFDGYVRVKQLKAICKFRLGIQSANAGNLYEGLQHLQKAVEIAPEEPVIRQQIDEVNKAIRYQEAFRQAQEVVEMINAISWRNPPTREKAFELLKKLQEAVEQSDGNSQIVALRDQLAKALSLR